MARLWPESDSRHARNLLNASVYAVRRGLGEGALVSNGDNLQLSHDIIDVDVVRFDRALANGDHEAGVALYRGVFLEGFFVRSSPEFGHWVDRERDHLSNAYAGALEALADDAEARDDWSAASRWWKTRVEHDPYDSRVALRLMHALAADGNPAGALHHARIHAELLRQEFGAAPAAQLLELAERLRLGPGSGR
jgi:DNA-binding SARP family transcriptional activator